MASSLAKSASESQALIANLSNAVLNALRQNAPMLGSKEILSALEDKGVPRKEIADVFQTQAESELRFCKIVLAEIASLCFMVLIRTKG